MANEGFITCSYCGQSIICDVELRDDQLAEFERNNCNCDSAKSYKKIKRLCGDDFDAGIIEEIYQLAWRVLLRDIEGATIALTSSTKLKIGFTSKGKLRLTREDKETTQEEV